MTDSSFKEPFQRELEMAEAARASGNEGRARVCARRAAGLIAGEYFTLAGISPIRSSAYDRLRDLRNLEDLSDEVYQIVDHLLLRVNTDQQLPVPVDLIEEARRLKSKLLD